MSDGLRQDLVRLEGVKEENDETRIYQNEY